MRQSKELQIGKAGEYLVCADLILKGFVAFPSEQGLPYDVLLDNGKRLLKIQVKTTTGLRVVPQRNKETKCYIFSIGRHGKNNLVKYTHDEIDIFALVCLDTKKIGYIKNSEMPETINIRSDELRGTHYDEKGISDHKLTTDMKKAGLSNSEIAEQVGIHVTQVYRYLQKKTIPFKTNARYFSDFERSPEWIEQL
jgi:hypothetical protein